MSDILGVLALEPPPDLISLADLSRHEWTIIATRSNAMEDFAQPWRYRIADANPHHAVARARGWEWDADIPRRTSKPATIMTMQRRRACRAGVPAVYDLLARLVPRAGQDGKLW